MIINHNMMANNAIRNMNINSGNASKSMQKLSSGLRINSAADDAAGLSISEKMRGQIRGLDQASSNAQDGISMVQTAEGALNETQSILQRMRELATQAGNDTNVTVDRDSIQKEMNQLSSEINRIGNTTEFNTQKLLTGDGTVSVDKTQKFTDVALSGGLTTNNQVSQLVTAMGSGVGANNDTITFTLNGQSVKITLASSTSTQVAGSTSDVTANSATAYIKSASNDKATTLSAVKAAIDAVIMKNDTLRGNFTTATSDATAKSFKITAGAGGSFAGAAGNIAATTTSASTNGVTGSAAVGTTTYTAAATTISLANLTPAAAEGKGMTINGQAIEFYDGSKGSYTGNAIGVDIKGATTATNVVDALVAQVGTKIPGVALTNSTTSLTITATQGGEAGNKIRVEDGGINKAFKATLQVGANQGQQFTVDINDMRSLALGVTSQVGQTDSETGAKFVSSNSVTNGTDSVTREASLDVSTAPNATNAIKTINNAIEKVSAERSKLGAFQNRLEHTINNLGTSSENLTSSESRIRDVDMAKEMSTFSKNNILSQAAQAMLAQANQQPQQVLQLLR